MPMLRSKQWCEYFSIGDKKLENTEGIEKLFFELASESRLSILRELQKENLKMQEIARRLDVTATEAFRQLERLSAALLVQRQPNGTFALAEYGKVVLQLSSSLEFVSKHKNYFSTHDIMRFPLQFVNRLGELSQAKLVMDTVKNLNNAERAFIEAEQYGWGIAEGTIPEHVIPMINERIQKGMKFKFLIPENRLSANVSPSATPKNVEIRGLPDLPAIVVLTEKEGGVCFRQVGGRVDYAGFFGKDPTFLNWVKDLFLYYWDKGKRA
jgi:predicted transcriptional regulator